jgi:hypothetical protein
MLRAFMSLIVTIMLSFLPVATYSMQQQQKTTTQQQSPTPNDISRCPTGCTGGGPTEFPPPPPTLSTAVFQVAQQKAQVLENEAVVGQIRTTDISAAATALQSAFANMDETGWTSTLQAWMLNNTTLFTSSSPSQSQMQNAYNQLVAQGGITETLAQFEAGITSVPLSDRQLLINQVQSGGLDSVHTLIVQAMNNFVSAGAQSAWWGIGAEYIGIVLLSASVAAGAPVAIIALGVAGAALGMVDVVEGLNE